LKRRKQITQFTLSAASKNGIAQLREGIEPRFAVEMPPIRHYLQVSFQVIGHTLRTRQWDIGIISTCPATVYMPLPFSDAGPVERVGKERMILNPAVVGLPVCAESLEQ
jgi:hypothetical protein